MEDALSREVERNMYAFLPKLRELLPEHEGSYALLRNQHIEGVHRKLGDALRAAYAQFADGIFSIQKITDKPVELGMFSNVENPR